MITMERSNRRCLLIRMSELRKIESLNHLYHGASNHPNNQTIIRSTALLMIITVIWKEEVVAIAINGRGKLSKSNSLVF